jgi:hypothetical protein
MVPASTFAHPTSSPLSSSKIRCNPNHQLRCGMRLRLISYCAWIQSLALRPLSPLRPSSASAAAGHARTDRLTATVDNTHQANISPTSQARKVQPGSGLSIKGTAVPFVVQARNVWRGPRRQGHPTIRRPIGLEKKDDLTCLPKRSDSHC